MFYKVFTYLIESAVCMSLLYFFYKYFFYKQTHFEWNRVFLILSVVCHSQSHPPHRGSDHGNIFNHLALCRSRFAGRQWRLAKTTDTRHPVDRGFNSDQRQAPHR